jgi:hypothetical protein
MTPALNFSLLVGPARWGERPREPKLRSSRRQEALINSESESRIPLSRSPYFSFQLSAFSYARFPISAFQLFSFLAF